MFTIPIQSETVMGSEAELEKNGQSCKNPSDYHQDWPMELKQIKIGQTTVDYFLVPSGDK